MSDQVRESLGRELLEFAPDAVVGVDRNGLIVLANPRSEEVFGYSREELRGQHIEILVPERFRPGHKEHRDGYFRSPRTRQLGAGIDLYARRKDGTEFPCEISLSAVETETGTVALAAVRDTTEWREAQDALNRALRRLQAATDVALAVGGEVELNRVLDAIVERGRALVEARALAILLRDGDDLTVAATATIPGGLDPPAAGLRIPADEASEEVLLGRFMGADGTSTTSGRALVAPLNFRGDPLGVVMALDRVGAPGRFDDEHRRLLEAFAASAATGVATARSIAEERLQHTIDAAEQERSRWARELHDETLQALAVLRMRLASALREQSHDALRRAGEGAVEQIDEEIVKLRNLITELRPASLDAIGLEAALRALAEQQQEASGIPVSCSFDLPPDDQKRLSPILETATYRLVQEALNNVSKHSAAEGAELAVLAGSETIAIEVADDGIGFEPSGVKQGFGIVGMRERAALLGGTLEVESAQGSGTRLRASLPLTS